MAHSLMEEALYTLKLYRLERIADLSLALPEVDGIEYKGLGKPLEYTRARGGQTFQVFELRYAVSAAQEGRYQLAPARRDTTPQP